METFFVLGPAVPSQIVRDYQQPEGAITRLCATARAMAFTDEGTWLNGAFEIMRITPPYQHWDANVLLFPAL